MIENIQEIIEKNLPAQVGKILQETLAQGEANKAKVESLNKEITSLKDTIKSLNNTINEYHSKDYLYMNLNVREDELNKLSQKIEIEKLTYQLQAEKEKTQFTKDVALGLVRNTNFRKNSFNTHTESNTNPYNLQTVSDNTSEETIIS